MFEVAYIIRCNNKNLFLVGFVWRDDLNRNAEFRPPNSHLNMEGMEVNWVVYISQCDLRINFFGLHAFLSGLEIHGHLIFFFVFIFISFHCLLLLKVLLLIKHINTSLITDLLHPASRPLTDLHLEETPAPNN